MAELVDASDSKSGIGNNVQVRFLFWALSRCIGCNHNYFTFVKYRESFSIKSSPTGRLYLSFNMNDWAFRAILSGIKTTFSEKDIETLTGSVQ